MDNTVSITFLRPRELLRNIGLLALLGVTVACQPRAEVTTEYTYTVIGERAHNTRLFTQGLLLRDDTFYESGGGYGRSRLVSYPRSEEHTSELQSRGHLVCRLLLEQI